MRCKVAKMFTVKCGEEARGNLVNRCITEKSSGNFVTNIWKVSSSSSSSLLLFHLLSLWDLRSTVWASRLSVFDTMENLIQLVNKIQRACTALGDHGEESALPTLWDALPSIAVVGGQVSLSLSLLI